MLREEAEQTLLGKYVSVWTACNGEYVGFLEEVLPRRPWRARVLITGVVRCACVWDVTRYTPRRGFRPGEYIEVGGSSIKKEDVANAGGTYLEALKAELKVCEDTLANPVVLEKHKFGLVPTIKNLKLCIEQEKV